MRYPHFMLSAKLIRLKYPRFLPLALVCIGIALRGYLGTLFGVALLVDNLPPLD